MDSEWQISERVFPGHMKYGAFYINFSRIYDIPVDLRVHETNSLFISTRLLRAVSGQLD